MKNLMMLVAVAMLTACSNPEDSLGGLYRKAQEEKQQGVQAPSSAASQVGTTTFEQQGSVVPAKAKGPTKKRDRLELGDEIGAASEEDLPARVGYAFLLMPSGISNAFVNRPVRLMT